MPRSVLCYETSQNYLGEQKEKANWAPRAPCQAVLRCDTNSACLPCAAAPCRAARRGVPPASG